MARVGTVLKDRWHLDALLGTGGMAWVYAATHRNKNRVAIKLLVPHLSHSADIQRRFLREGYAANSIGHPGAVKVFDDDVTEDGLAFLVMELLEGKTLAELRREAGGRLEPKTVLRYTDKVLDVLVAAHEHGIIHRDIKPSNIFVTREGNAKIVDFGIARICEVEQEDEETQTGLLLGSAPFMPPEQARGRWDLVDARTDLWSLGATMFQLLAGRAVHEAKTPPERLMAAMSQQARSLADVMPAMPRPVVDLVDRALSFDRETRWQSAREMQSRVRAAITELGDLGATLFVGAPPPEISAPDASSGPYFPQAGTAFDEIPISEPVPSPLSGPTVREPTSKAPVALGATRVLGSDPLASLGPIPEPAGNKIPLSDTHRYGSPIAGGALPPVPAPATLKPDTPAPLAQSYPLPGAVPPPVVPSSAPVVGSSPVKPVPIEIRVDSERDSSTTAAGSLTGSTRLPAPRRSPVIIAGVVSILVGAALLSLAGLGLYAMNRQSSAAAASAPATGGLVAPAPDPPRAAAPAESSSPASAPQEPAEVDAGPAGGEPTPAAASASATRAPRVTGPAPASKPRKKVDPYSLR